MSQLSSLRAIDFGKLAAENDDLLSRYFVRTEAFERVLDGERWFVLGNRGSGKTAIFRGLADSKRRSGDIIIHLKPEDYSYELASEVLAKEMDGNWQKGGAFTVAWKWLILKLTLENLADDSAGRRRRTEGHIHAFMRDHYANQDLNPIDSLISFMKRIEAIKIGKLGEVGVKTSSLQGIFRLDEFKPVISDLQEALSRRPVHVIIDELDRGWDASEDAQFFVSGLFRAAVNLNTEFEGLHVYVSLRQELYESIPALYEDAQKHRDVIQQLRWDELNLRELIAGRIRQSIGAQSMSDDEAWTLVFGEVLSYRNTRPFRYITDRTTNRPRELISFCTSIRDMAVERNQEIDYSVIADAERRYSKDRFDDIVREYRFQYPGLQNIFEYFRGRLYLIDRSALMDDCTEVICSDRHLRDAPWLADKEPEGLAETLWEVGFLLARNVGGQKGLVRSGSQYIGVYQHPSMALDKIQTFKIHPMFHAHLGLREKKSPTES